jgi:hypothetical protein
LSGSDQIENIDAGRIDSHRNARLRGVLEPLARRAATWRVA